MPVCLLPAHGRRSSVLAPGFSVACFCCSIGNFTTIGFSKTVLGTRFAYWDTHLYSPLCLGLAVLAGIVASRGVILHSPGRM
ncbi:MAG: DUF3995 domain-containing protein [Terriglobales bacterium]